MNLFVLQLQLRPQQQLQPRLLLQQRLLLQPPQQLQPVSFKLKTLFLDPERQAKGSYTFTFFVTC